MQLCIAGCCDAQAAAGAAALNVLRSHLLPLLRSHLLPLLQASVGERSWLGVPGAAGLLICSSRHMVPFVTACS